MNQSIQPKKKDFAAYVLMFFWVYGLATVIFKYGFLYIFPFIPLALIFLNFSGIPQIIYVLRLYKLFPRVHICITCSIQFVFFLGLCLILNWLKMQGLIPYFVIGGLLMGLTTPQKSLVEERKDQIGNS
tara:strand:- start:1029 stop:1415 length:387 start_codon:yes stop_codon:yes gene_type:complete